MINLKKINITVDGTELQVLEDLKTIEENGEKIGELSYFRDRSSMSIIGVIFFKLPLGGDLANQLILKGWKKCSIISFKKELSPEQNQEIEAEWVRVSGEFDRMLLSGEIKMFLRKSERSSDVFLKVEDCINSTLSDFYLQGFLRELTYYWQNKYDLNHIYLYSEKITTELAEKGSVNITRPAIEIIKKKIQEEEQDRIRIDQIIEKEQAEIEQAKKEELMIYGEEILSCNTNKLLHSLAIHYNDKIIKLYTTAYAKKIPEANTSYTIKEILKKEGFKFNGKDKNWLLPYNKENLNKAIEILRKYDSKEEPRKIGLHRCWECGCYSSRLDSDGYCGCGG